MSFIDDALESLADMQVNRLNLRMLFRHKERLIPFVGAGMSADFGYPSWHKLIEQLAEPAGLVDEVRELLVQHKFEEAAERIVDILPNQFDDTLRETFDVNELKRPFAKGAVTHIPRIARGLVITTNFDCVLEAAFEDARMPFEQVFSGARIREATRAVQLNEKCLLKLHGDYRDSQHRILTLAEYTREYGTGPSVDTDLPLPRVLGQALASRPILFLGCSLKTDRTIGVISSLAKRYPGVVQFALLSAAEATPSRMHQLDQWNIRPLFFPAGEFFRIEQFLKCLARYCRLGLDPTPRVATGSTGRSTRQPPPAPALSARRAERVNGYKLFYFRRMQKLGIKALATKAGVPEGEILRIERMRTTGVLGSHCFNSCDVDIIERLEEALGCGNVLKAGRADDFLALYMMFYKIYRGTRTVKDQDDEQLELSFETKAVVFDFDGTLTTRTDDETTWEKIWVLLGYSIQECAELHNKYSQGKFDHPTWCRITCDKFKARKFHRDQLLDIARSTSLIDGTRETLEVLRERGVKLFVLSGSIKQVIKTVLGDLNDWFEDVQANSMVFDRSGLLRDIQGTQYDFEGKAQFLSSLIQENGYSPYDVLFVGNSCNDVFASQSGARTLCVNARGTNPDVKEHWTYFIRRMDNLTQILKYAQL